MRKFIYRNEGTLIWGFCIFLFIVMIAGFAIGEAEKEKKASTLYKIIFDNHEWIVNANGNAFVHSPNCNCKTEKEMKTIIFDN